MNLEVTVVNKKISVKQEEEKKKRVVWPKAKQADYNSIVDHVALVILLVFGV